MPTTTTTTAATTTTTTPPQRWAVVAAWAAFASTVPSALWRVLMVAGLVPGTADLQALHADEVGYVVGLSVVQLTAGALTLGLVRPWGERVGRVRVPRLLPVVVGGLGGLVVTWLFTVTMTWQLAHGVRPDQSTVHGGALAVMVACYLPILLWGPLELAAVAGYHVRRRRDPLPGRRGPATAPGRLIGWRPTPRPRARCRRAGARPARG